MSFRTKVTAKEAPDYHEVIKNPIDLSVIMNVSLTWKMELKENRKRGRINTRAERRSWPTST